MPRAHKVWLSKLTCLATRLNAELDKGSTISIADAKTAMENHRVVALIKERFGMEHRLGEIGILEKEDDITISEYFYCTMDELPPESLRVFHNGLCYFLALLIEMIAQQEWTTYDDPTSGL